MKAERRSRAQDHGALQRIAQLAHVAGPAVALQRLHRVPVDPLHLLVELLVESVDEVPREDRDVIDALVKRRDEDGEGVEPVEEVGAEEAAQYVLILQQV